MVKRIALIGAAGAGKSTLVFSFSKFLEKRGLTVACVNLDPGCRHIKYPAAYDVRRDFSLDDTMKRHDLGPNAALKKIYESLVSRRVVADAVSKAGKPDIVLLDTAGSLELFLLGSVSHSLSGIADAVLFVCDSESVSDGEDASVLRAVNAIQRLKYALPTLTVVNKSDVLEKKAKSLSQHRLGGRGAGGFGAVDEHLQNLLLEIGRREKLVFVSAIERSGFPQLQDAINELFCECGE
ncbi:MAG: ATP/GTP-binding protein [Candidatus Micrarchaeia archaeon]